MCSSPNSIQRFSKFLEVILDQFRYASDMSQSPQHDATGRPHLHCLAIKFNFISECSLLQAILCTLQKIIFTDSTAFFP